MLTRRSKLTGSSQGSWKNNNERKTDVFVSTLTKIFSLSTWFGIPTYGNKIAYVYAIVILLVLLAIEVASIWRVIRSLAGIAQHDSDGRGVTARLSGAIFYCNALLSQILSWRLIFSWRKLSQHWIKVETTALYLPPDPNIRRRVLIVTCFVAVCAFGAVLIISTTVYKPRPPELATEIIKCLLLSLITVLLTYFIVGIANQFRSVPQTIIRASVRVDDTTVSLPSKRNHRVVRPKLVGDSNYKILEHMLSMMSATGFDIPPEEYFDRYILSSHGFLLNSEILKLWNAVPVFILSKLATILWNFQDLIIILISMGLTSRYHRLNLYVNRVVRVHRQSGSKKIGANMFLQIHIWRRLREAYVRQSALVRMVDSHLGALVLLSNINNFYFICLQLFLGLHRGERGLVNRMYYFLSLGWLMFRACSVVLAAADIHLHSKKALLYLSQYPDTSYNVEIRRLKHQLTHDHVALSGMGFFSLDRQKLLEVAANIVKYELVLIQYDK